MNKIKIIADKFSGGKIIDWEYVAHRIPKKYGYQFEDAIVTGANNDNFSKLIFSPINKDGKNFLRIRFQENYFKSKKGDTLTFLFDDDSILLFPIISEPYESLKHSDWGTMKEIYVPINERELKTFGIKRFVSWKYKSAHKELLFKNGVFEEFRLLDNLQIAILSVFEDFIKIILVESPESLNEVPPNKDDIDQTCYIYLMKDISNGCYKIGISNSPEYRERTLQSEKPTIELIHSKSFHKRIIAEIFEKVLHEYYKSNRVRGEWFELTNNDIQDLLILLK